MKKKVNRELKCTVRELYLAIARKKTVKGKPVKVEIKI